MKTLVLGLGNPILTDDGVGVRVAEAVLSALNGEQTGQQFGGWGSAAPFLCSAPQAHKIDVQEVSVGGLTLMETMLGYDQVILVDAFEQEGMAPGTIQRMTLDDLRTVSPTQHSASPHDASLVTAFDLGQRMGLPLPAASQIVIFAIGVENVLDFGDQPTPAVAAAIPVVASAVLAELDKMTEPYTYQQPAMVA